MIQLKVPLSVIAALLALTPLNASAQQEIYSGPMTVEPDAWFPQTRTSDRGSAVLFAPQIESWDGFNTMVAWMAFQITATGADREPFGSVKFRARTDVDLTNREVLLYDLEIIELTIPGLYDFELEYSIMRDALLSNSKKIPLDLVLEYLPKEMTIASTTGLSLKPPPIYVSTSSAMLLTVDSLPMFIPIGKTGIGFALNANWNLFREENKEVYYLLNSTDWMKAPSLDGPWTWTNSLPESMAKMTDDVVLKEAREALPEDLENIPLPERDVPFVFYSTIPAELILFDGDPQWDAVGDTGIQFAINTKQECFLHEDIIYFMASGRWFMASSLEDSWALCQNLPEAFQAIPADHEVGYVRASIPGTEEAWEAALVATIPQSVKIKKSEANNLAPTVSYSGDPEFQAIEGTSLEMAINTSYQVIKYLNAYYLCYNAVWFNASTPMGPWEFADLIPSEFSKIPPSSPAHNTTYVTVAESTSDAVVYSSTAGYQNSYVSDSGSVVNGTGFVQSALAVWMVYEIIDNSDGYWYGYPPYPYYPWPPSYGYGSWYNPNTGRYGESITGYGPFGAARSTAVFNPDTGVYGRGQSVWDSDEWAGRSYTYNPNTDTSIGRRGYYDFDDDEGWSERVTRRGDEWVYAETEWDDGHMRTDIETSRGGEGTVNRERDGDETSGSGSFTSGRGNELDSEFSRERDGDEINTDRTISGENRSVDISGSVVDGEGSFSFSGSEGGSGSANRELEDGELSGSGSFTKNGKTIDSETSRTGEGVTREFDSSTGGELKTARQGDERAFVGESSGGDVYAGRDGEVYKKTDDGWDKVESSQNTTRSQNQAATTSSSSRDAPSPGMFKDRSTYDTRQLDRERQSRQRGYQKYESFRSNRSRSSPSPSRSSGRRSRR